MTSFRLLAVLSIGASLVGCAAGTPSASPTAFADTLIVRDDFGVPHIYGPTDASVVFGLGYAQAEDDVLHVEDNFVRALGRGAEIYGEAAVRDDLVTRALEIPRLAREEYERAEPTMRSIYDAYAAGLNLWVERNPGALRLLTRFEPWHTLAFLRFKYYVGEFVAYAGVRADEIDPEAWRAPENRPPVEDREWEEPPTGSNAWAIAPQKTMDGYAMLFVNPHVAFSGPGLYYESHLVSDEGWDFSGVGRYGFPFAYMGHNARLGWALTDNYPDHGDLYAETFDDPSDPLAYRYDDGYRRATQWTETIRIGDGTREVTFRKTHHGPILLARDGKPIAVKLAKLESGGWYDQHRAMSRATTLEEFRAAMARGAIPYMNVTYADADGNIDYTYNGVVPRRDSALDWQQPVDGSTAATEWQGFHDLDELPRVHNPSAGFVLNTNSTPFTASTTDVPTRDRFPDYMIGPETDNARAKVSRQILTETSRFDFAGLARAALDTRVFAAQSWQEAVRAEWARLPDSAGERRDRLATSVALLLDWDGVSTVDSTAMTLLVLAAEARGRARGADDFPHLTALERAIAKLESDWGSAAVPWGEINRLQRRHWNRLEAFDDAAESLAVPGGPGRLGMAFVFTAPDTPPLRRRYGRHGNSYVSVVEFGPEVRARSIVFFGQSGARQSPHYFDQAPIYAAAGFKNAWFHWRDVRTHVTRSYRPAVDR